MLNIIPKRKIWLSLSGIVVGLSAVALIIWGLNFGIDFTGGSLLEVKFLGERPTVSSVQEALSNLDLGSLIVQPIAEDGMILRFQEIDEDKHHEAIKILSELTSPQADKTSDNIEARVEAEAIDNSDAESGIDEQGEVELGIEVVSPSSIEVDRIEELRFDSVGPSIGKELKSKSISAIILVLIAIVLYIAWVFRGISKPVASWKYGLTAIITLFHDVLITLGVFAVLGKFYGTEINTAFVAAILTVLGYSVNDTIVVFDRVRENLPKSEEDFEGTVNNSVNQTIGRSVNTSLTTLLVLLSIFFFGGATIKSFVLALSIGVFVGTYSSIFIASPILVIWEKIKR